MAGWPATSLCFGFGLQRQDFQCSPTPANPYVWTADRNFRSSVKSGLMQVKWAVSGTLYYRLDLAQTACYGREDPN